MEFWLPKSSVTMSSWIVLSVPLLIAVSSKNTAKASFPSFALDICSFVCACVFCSANNAAKELQTMLKLADTTSVQAAKLALRFGNILPLFIFCFFGVPPFVFH